MVLPDTYVDPLSELDYILTLSNPTIHPKSITELNSF